MIEGVEADLSAGGLVFRLFSALGVVPQEFL